MKNFQLIAIPGTQKWVRQELELKFPEVKEIKLKGNKLSFDYNSNRVEDFRSLNLPLSTIRTDVDNDSMRIDNSQRDWRVGYIGNGGINPSLASVMCWIAKISSSDVVADPFCGSSIIPVTAKLQFNAKRVFASDISGRAIDESLKNFNSAGLKRKRDYVLSRGDVKNINLKQQSVDKVITNLPFGIRKSDHATNVEIYRNFAKKIKKWLKPEGEVILLTLEKKLIESTFSSGEFKLNLITTISQGGLNPDIYSIQFRDG